MDMIKNRLIKLVRKQKIYVTFEKWINNGKGTIEGDPMIMFMMKNSLEREMTFGPVGQYLD